MADFMDRQQRSAHMALIRSKNTKPEVAVRKLLHGLGYRYRLHVKDLPGKPDLVFPGRRKVLFVNGCFWHAHSCPEGQRVPKTNSEFWLNKRLRNAQRDSRQRVELHELGWDFYDVWECEIKNDPVMPKRVVQFLERDIT